MPTAGKLLPTMISIGMVFVCASHNLAPLLGSAQMCPYWKAVHSTGLTDTSAQPTLEAISAADMRTSWCGSTSPCSTLWRSCGFLASRRLKIRLR